jgi:hypothetical protein
MEDTTLLVLDIRALDVNEGDEYLTLAMIKAIQTPFPGPDGQPISLVSGVVKVPMGKQAARELIGSLQEQVDKLPDPKRPSGIVVPGSPAEVDQVAQNLKRFK